MPDTAVQLQTPAADRPDGKPLLSVIVPCFNERLNVAPMIAKLDAALAGIAWEVIYVDDNSPDGTTGRSAASPARTPGCAASAVSAAAAWHQR